MGTHSFASRRWALLGSASVAVAAAVAGLLTSAGTASAAPQPTASQVQARLNKLDKLDNVAIEKYDQQTQQLSSARQRLAIVNDEVSRDEKSMSSMRGQIAQIASTMYEDGSLTSIAALVTSSNPSAILGQSAILVHLSSSNAEELRQFISVERNLLAAQALAKRTEQGEVAINRQLAAQKSSLNKRVAQTKALLASLTPAQRTGVLGGGGSTSGSYTGPTSTQAERAVAYAYAQIGCQYVYGATGPCSSGFDCSGLMMAAWAYAGVEIPRDSYEQATLPAASTLQPGDIMEFAGDSHVGMYVGNGYLIDAPTFGIPVEKVSIHSTWYAQNFDGAVRP